MGRRAERQDTSRWSLWSEGSLLSIASKNSLLSIGSVGSVLSVGSVGSAGSVLSIGSAGSVGSALSSFSRWSLMSHRADRVIAGAGQSGSARATGWLAAITVAALIADRLVRDRRS